MVWTDILTKKQIQYFFHHQTQPFTFFKTRKVTPLHRIQNTNNAKPTIIQFTITSHYRKAANNYNHTKF